MKQTTDFITGGFFMKTTLYVEYDGNQAEDKQIIAQIKEIWVADGNRVKDIKELKVYVKPEENAAYYVINGDVSGSISLY